MKRKTKDWLASFEEFTAPLPSPALLRRWAGIAILAGALERKCWVRTLGRPLYPNLYTIIVAPPGVGKSLVTSLVWDFWSELGTHHVCPTSITKAALMDHLVESQRHVIRVGHATETFNSLLIASNELSTLLPQYDVEFMSVLTDLYDGYPYAERRRGKDINFKLNKPQFNLTAAITPSDLKDKLPEGAWDRGFLSRCILVYNGDNLITDLFEDVKVSDALKSDLLHDLKYIGEQYHEFRWDNQAKELMQTWHAEGGPPAPTHPKLLHYTTRRTAHLLKLCQVSCMSDFTGDPTITADHFDRALSWLIEVEHHMPDIFKAMANGGDAQLIRECYHYAFQVFAKEKKPIREARIFRWLSDRTPSHNVERLIDIMVKGERFRRTEENKIGACLTPLLPRTHEQ